MYSNINSIVNVYKTVLRFSSQACSRLGVWVDAKDKVGDDDSGQSHDEIASLVQSGQPKANACIPRQVANAVEEVVGDRKGENKLGANDDRRWQVHGFHQLKVVREVTGQSQQCDGSQCHRTLHHNTCHSVCQ